MVAAFVNGLPELFRNWFILEAAGLHSSRLGDDWVWQGAKRVVVQDNVPLEGLSSLQGNYSLDV